MKQENKYLQEARQKLVEAEANYKKATQTVEDILQQVCKPSHPDFGDSTKLFKLQMERRSADHVLYHARREVRLAEENEVLHLIHEDVLKQLKELEKK